MGILACNELLPPVGFSFHGQMWSKWLVSHGGGFSVSDSSLCQSLWVKNEFSPSQRPSKQQHCCIEVPLIPKVSFSFNKIPQITYTSMINMPCLHTSGIFNALHQQSFILLKVYRFHISFLISTVQMKSKKFLSSFPLQFKKRKTVTKNIKRGALKNLRKKNFLSS